jgi:glycosyltransferase involved in cell wall biosynthesis
VSRAARFEPLVAVVTPVHDGAAHLRRCIESVLRQEYDNWIHIIVDNASRDGTRAIVEELADRDDRIVPSAQPDFVGMMENFNRALALVPEQAVYVKQLHADDALFPECLRRMVDAAESHPHAAIVTGRRYSGGVLRPDGGPSEQTVVPGPEVARAALLGGLNYLGTPSLPLLRRQQMVGWPRLFDAASFPPDHPMSPPFCHADKEAYLPTLEKANLVFIPRALIDQRRDTHSATGFAQRVAGWHPSRIELLLRHGARFLEPSELKNGVRRAVLRYTRSLGWRVSRHAALRDPEFVRYQALAIDHCRRRLEEASLPAEGLALAPFAALLRNVVESRAA